MHVIISIHTGLYPQSLFGLLSLTDSSSHTGLNALPLATISPHGEHHFCAEFAIPNQRLGVTMAQTLVSPKSPLSTDFAPRTQVSAETDSYYHGRGIAFPRHPIAFFHHNWLFHTISVAWVN